MGSSATVPQEGAKSGHSLRRCWCYPPQEQRQQHARDPQACSYSCRRHCRISQLAGADEEGTLARLRALRSELINPTIADHNGRVVKRTGDGLIVEFRSVIDAVRCAIKMQTGVAERDVGFPPERLMAFRIGIHVGDVVEEADGDLMGEGVNIAARIEGVCEPGGVAVSEDAWRQAEGKIAAEAIDAGVPSLKNISRTVRIYRLSFGERRRTAATVVAGRTPDKPTIAVLPFENMSGNAGTRPFL